MEGPVSELPIEPHDQRAALVALYDAAVSAVNGYLVSRCGSAAVAEDLASETSSRRSTQCGRDPSPT